MGQNLCAPDDVYQYLSKFARWPELEQKSKATEMVPSKFYSLDESMTKLNVQGGGGLGKACTGPAVNLVQ